MIIQNLPTERRVKLHASTLTSIRFFFVCLLKKFALQLLKSRGKFGIFCRKVDSTVLDTWWLLRDIISGDNLNTVQ